jgi:hypothetical protein
MVGLGVLARSPSEQQLLCGRRVAESTTDFLRYSGS